MFPHCYSSFGERPKFRLVWLVKWINMGYEYYVIINRIRVYPRRERIETR